MFKMLEVKNLSKHFNMPGRVLKAVDDVSFSISEGETLGIVGESGCGKTTCGRTCTGMYKKTSGSVLYKGKEVSQLRKDSRTDFAKEVQCIFQDPYSSLDPRMRIGDMIAEGIDVHHIVGERTERDDYIVELLEKVGLQRFHKDRYAHEFSGGQRQRIGIARALSVNPKFIFCDEPISALDVSVQAQIMNLLMDMQEEKNLTYMFVSHDISMVRHISDRIAVFYKGRIVEIGDANEIYFHAAHPYTKALLSAIPLAFPDKEQRKKEDMLQGDISDAVLPKGCVFQNRCRYASKACSEFGGDLREIASGHDVACALI